MHQLKAAKKASVAVIVLGDLGRSPRMQQHVIELRRLFSLETLQIYFIGTEGTSCREELETCSGVTLYRLKTPWIEAFRFHWIRNWLLGQLVFAGLKVLDQSVRLVYALASLHGLRCVIVQNPPSVPTLPLVSILKRIYGWSLVVDWHNYGSSILALSPASKRLVPLYHWMERRFGADADAAFCVSHAMKAELVKEWNIPSKRLAVLYDRPPSSFRALTEEEKDGFLTLYFPGKIPHSPPPIIPELRMMTDTEEFSLLKEKESWFTTAANECRPQRPALLITATSWTPDENLDLLLSVLIRYNDKACTGAVPPIVMIITGKGTLQKGWIDKASRIQWSHVYIYTAFLPYSHYWKLVCEEYVLHRCRKK